MKLTMSKISKQIIHGRCRNKINRSSFSECIQAGRGCRVPFPIGYEEKWAQESQQRL